MKKKVKGKKINCSKDLLESEYPPREKIPFSVFFSKMLKFQKVKSYQYEEIQAFMNSNGLSDSEYFEDYIYILGLF